MKLLHLIPYFVKANKTGGPAMQVSRLAAAEQSLGNKIQILTTTGNLEDEVDITFSGDFFETIENDLPIVYLRRKANIIPPTFYFAPDFCNWLLRHISDFDLIIIHGIWTYFSWMGSKICQRVGKPYLFFLHGSLDPWALKHHGLKKSLYWHLIEKNNISKSNGVIVLSREEAGQLQDVGIEKNTYLARNGLVYPLKHILDPKSAISHYLPGIGSNPYVFFMSRLHPKKGIVVLLKAWADLQDQFPEWRLVIAGPDEGGHLANLKSLIDELHIAKSVIFPGLVEGDLKVSLLEKASIFVLPSYSEGVPGAVIEAMAYGLPVIITPQCHLPEVGEVQAGLIVNPEKVAMAESLKLLIGNAALRQKMGENAERLARDLFDESNVAAGLVDFCQQVVADVTRE